MTRTEPISYVEATIRALEEDNAELLAEIARLRAALVNHANAIEKLAFDMRPPNPYTPQFVHLAVLMKQASRAALTAQPAEGEK